MKVGESIHNNVDDTSEYLTSGDPIGHLDLTDLSDQFTNIRKIFTSAANPSELHSASRFGKRYILKGITKDFRNDPIQNLALSKEFEIGLSLDHPNIRRTIGFEKIDGLGKVIVLEYFDGKTLTEYMKSESLTPNQARSIVNQIASALSYIHSKQILYRDLKPSNILISHQGLYVKIIDFNLSDSDSFLILKSPGGTYNYIAPELLDDTASPSVASDIFSFGVIAREIAEAAGDAALKKIAAQCTATDPHKRPGSIDELNLPGPERTKTVFFASGILTYALCSICLILIALIYYFINSKNLL